MDKPATHNEPIIRIRNLTSMFGSRVILDDVNLDIFPKEISVILGGSGSGKTTLLKNILRLYEPTSGSIEILGNEITTMDEGEFDNLLRQIGMLFQNGALLNSVTVYDNISIPLEQHTKLPPAITDRIIRQKLDCVGLSEAIHLLPSELSGGMRKRAALARAIALDPVILFCDEPSAGLDPVTSASLDDLILTLKDQLQMSFVIITHELPSIHRIADRILFLKDGRIVFSGSPKEAVESGESALQDFFNAGTYS